MNRSSLLATLVVVATSMSSCSSSRVGSQSTDSKPAVAPEKNSADEPDTKRRSAAAVELPDGLSSAFGSDQTLAIARVRLGGWVDLRPFAERFEPTSLPQRARGLLETLVQDGPLGLTEPVLGITGERWESLLPHLDSDRDLFVRVDLALPDSLELLVRSGFALHPPLASDHQPFTFTTYFPSRDPQALAAALREQDPEVAVASIGSWVVVGPGVDSSEAAAADVAVRRTSAIAAFVDGNALASLWVSDARLKHFLAYRPLANVYEWLPKVAEDGRAYAILRTVALTYGEDRQYRGYPSEYEDHVLVLKANDGVRLETTHTHTRWGRTVAEALTTGDVDVPDLQTADHEIGLDWTGALDTAALKRVYDGRLQPLSLPNYDPVTCLRELLPRTVSLNVSLLRCLTSWKAMAGVMPEAIRAVSWRDGKTPGYAALLVMKGGEAEAVALRDQIKLPSQTHVKTQVVDDARFGVLLTTDSRVEMGAAKDRSEGRSRAEIDVASTPQWVSPELAAVIARFGVVFEVTPEATFTAAEILGQAPTALDTNVTGAEPIEANTTPACHADLHRALGGFPELMHEMEIAAPEERAALADREIRKILDQTKTASDACASAHPASAERYPRLLGVVHWMAAMLQESQGKDKAAAALYDEACRLGEPMACGGVR